MTPSQITAALIADLAPLTFGPPVTHVYNPLVYARAPYERYWQRYGATPREVVLVGMNPGPWGMVQTGVPFGEVTLVREWLGITEPVGRPAVTHPKRPVPGFACTRSEVSGRRLWGWARERFGHPERFFERFFVANYCPLTFMEASGRNRTPAQLPAVERRALETACDRALERALAWLQPRVVMGIGRYAAGAVHRVAHERKGIVTGSITHPSPANPRANRGWATQVEMELAKVDVVV